jgi:protocatechuate 3,4-dioxygenase beta subunit
MEPRLFLSASTLYVGAVYVEEDLGSDLHGDTFYLTFAGGAPGTQLRNVVISGDQNDPGFGADDVFFDTERSTAGEGSRRYGADEAFPVTILSHEGIDEVRPFVVDGSLELRFEFVGFDAGETLIFSVDVDEIEEFDPSETNVDRINEGFDPLTSGVEFQGSMLQAFFQAKNYEDATLKSEFRNLYDALLADKPLELPADDADGKRDRTTGTAAELRQAVIPAQLGGHVYHDRNENGRRDSNEEGIADARLQIVPIETIEPQGTVEVTTDESGNYLVTNLAPGAYRIIELQPAGWLDGLDAVGTVDGRASGSTQNPGDTIDQIFLNGGSKGIDYDFGELLPVSVEGHVHLANEDGDCFSEDVFHEPIAGVAVQLFDAQGNLVAETTTNSAGQYRFSGLRPGVYTIVEHTPAGLLEGGARAGHVVGRLEGSVVDSNRISSIKLVSGEQGTDFDFCEIEPITVSGNVHLATPDGDCFGESVDHRPLAGTTVKLLDARGDVLAETVTDQRGDYAFENLPPGTYSVVEVTPADLIEGGARAGLVDHKPVGVVDGPNRISHIVVGPGQRAIEYEFCEFEPASLSGFVYHDANNDGLYSPAEQPIAGVQLTLIDGSGTVVRMSTTDEKGQYRFDKLNAGAYTIRESQPRNWLDGLDTPGTISGRVVGVADSSADAIRDVTLKWGDDGVQYNFGELLPVSLAGSVHLGTADGDCFSQTVDHPPLADVVVQLLDRSGTVIRETRTDQSGNYHFDNLPPGEYGLRELTPAELLEGGALAGSASGTEIGKVIDWNTIVGASLPSGQAGIGFDFCDFPPASLSGYVYHDANNNGIRESSESPIAGTRLQLLNFSGDVIAETVTSDKGDYQFLRLSRGVYSIVEVHPDPWLDGTDSPGRINGLPVGVADQPGDRIHSISLGFGEAGTEYNFGELLPGRIEGLIHADYAITNCIPEPERGDKLLANVRVELLDEQGVVVRATLTDQNGRFEFSGLRPGDYSLREVQPEGYFDGDSRRNDARVSVQDSSNFIADIHLSSGDVLVDYGFCEDPPVEITGFVYQDGPAIELALGQQLPDDVYQMRDGQKTADDVPIAGVVLELRVGPTGAPFDPKLALPGQYADGIAIAVTDQNGFYRFSGIKQGMYAVYERQPDGFIDGLDSGGTSPQIEGVSLKRPEAINQNDPLSSLALKSLQSPPGFDVIRFIELPPGTSSEMNNFSEIIVQSASLPIVFLPAQSPSLSRQAPLSVEPYRTAKRPMEVDLVQKISYGRVRGRGNTWHLSVIDGGMPRGQGETVSLPESIWLVSGPSGRSWQFTTMSAKEWTLYYSDGASRQYHFGVQNSLPVSGDFNGDGIAEIGVFYRGHWFIDVNGNGRWDDADLWAKLGHKDDQPVTGDWDGDGKDDIGVFGRAWPGDPHAVRYEPGLPDHENGPTGEPKNMPPDPDDASHGRRTMQLTARGRTRSDLIDHVFHFGGAADLAVSGDWNGDGVSTVGVFIKGRWRLDRDGDGRFTDSDEEAVFGRLGDIPIVGDFNGDGIDDIAIYREGQFILDMNGNRRIDASDRVIRVDRPGKPVVGDWDGDGADDVGVVADSLQFVEIEARLP